MAKFPQIKIEHNIGNTITIPNQLDVKVSTFLSTDKLAGATVLPVENAVEFTAGTISLLLSSMGAENAEIVTAIQHDSVSFQIGATLMPHNRGDLISQLVYDQVVVSHCATENGSYAVLSTTGFQVTQQNTIVLHAAGLSSTFYKLQWRNSLTGAVSDYSEPISVDTYSEESVAMIVYPVLDAMGVDRNDPKINISFCLSAIQDARKYVKAKLYGVRHAWNQKFEFPIKVLAGTNFVDLPDDIDFDETDRSLLSARFLIGNVLTPFNLRYIDKRSWNQIAWSVMGGLTEVEAAIAATTLTLNSVGDFSPLANADGVAYIATTDFDQELLQIGFTGVNLLTNQLTGVTGIDRVIPAGTQVWFQPTIAQPIYYTVFEDKLWFDRIVPDSMQGNNVYIDYYKKLDPVISLSQELEEPYREIYKWYLRWAIKYRKDISLDSKDPDLVKFEGLVEALFNNLYTGQDTTIITS